MNLNFIFYITLSLILDEHAPLKKCNRSLRAQKPFLTKDILFEKSKTSKLESIYRCCKAHQNRQNYKAQSCLVAKLITASRRSYYRTLVSSC